VDIAAVNGGGASLPSNLVTFSIGVTTRPEPPTALAATAVDDRVAIAWQPAAAGPAPSGYIVEAAAAGASTFAEVARTSSPSLVVTGAPSGAWQVRVRATTAGGSGLPSAPISFTTSACTLPPASPQQPWSLWTPPAFTVQWARPLTGSVDAYVLEIGSSSGSADLGRIVVPGDRLSVTQDVATIRAFVRVRARNACGESAPSAEVVVSTR
jgi:predicted phage tail protein